MIKDFPAMLEQTCSDFGAISLWVFGSREDYAVDLMSHRSPEAASDDSDLDVGVLFPRKSAPDAQTRVRLANALEDIFSVNRIDLVVLNEASPYLAVDVIQGTQLIDLNPKAAAEFELYALRRAGDLLPYRRAKIDAVLNEGAR